MEIFESSPYIAIFSAIRLIFSVMELFALLYKNLLEIPKVKRFLRFRSFSSPRQETSEQCKPILRLSHRKLHCHCQKILFDLGRLLLTENKVIEDRLYCVRLNLKFYSLYYKLSISNIQFFTPKHPFDEKESVFIFIIP